MWFTAWSRACRFINPILVASTFRPDGVASNYPRIARRLAFAELELTVTQAAAALGVSRKTLSSILNGRSGISSEMAVRLSLAFGTTAESWMNQQVQYDLWHAERNRKKLRVASLRTAGFISNRVRQ